MYYDTDSARTYCTPQTGSCQPTLYAEPLVQYWFRESATWSAPRGQGTSWAGGETCQENPQACPSLAEAERRPQTALDLSNLSATPQVDVAAVVQRMLDGSLPNFGFRLSLKNTDSHATTSDVTLCAMNVCGDTDHARSPRLILDFVPDSQAPAGVTIVEPVENSTLQFPTGTAVFVDATDQADSTTGHVSRVELFVDGHLASTAWSRVGSYYPLSMSPEFNTAGHHRLFARVYDRAGNYTDSAMRNVNFQGGLMAPPSNLVVTAADANTYRLTWARAMLSADDNQNAGSITYQVERSFTADFSTVSTVASGLTDLTYTASSATGGFYFRVKAANPVDGRLGYPSNVATKLAPIAPYGVTGQPLASGSIKLAWQPSPSRYYDSSVTYAVTRSDNGGAPVQVQSGLTDTAWTDTTAADGHTYTYQVTAVDPMGAASTTADCTVTASVSVGPDAPSDVRAIGGGGNVITVLWKASDVPSVTYNVERSTDRNTWTTAGSGISGWLYTDTGLSEGTTYYYRVQAVQGSNSGPYSLTAGAMAVSQQRRGIDSRLPYTAFPAADGTAYVNLNTGSLVFTATDSAIPAPYLPAVVRRTYNSQGEAGAAFGEGWRLNAEWSVRDFGGYVLLTAGDGMERRYTLVGSSYQADDLMWYWTLSKNGDGTFSLTRPDLIQYHFDSRGRLDTVSERNGNQITYSYNSTTGRLATITDPVSRSSALSYVYANAISVSDGAGRASTYLYDARGSMTGVTNALGQASSYGYDSAGRMVYAADPAGRLVAMTYDDTGRVSSATDSLGNRTTIAYSTNGTGGGTTVVTDPNQHTATYAYNSSGLLTAFTDALQHTWTYSYTFMPSDSTKLASQQIVNPQGLTTTLAYDSTGNVVTATNQGTDLTAPGVSSLQNQMTYVAGSSDLQTVTDALNQQTTYTWSGTTPRRLDAVADPLANSTRYTYVGKGLVQTVTDANNHGVNYAYDAYGNMTSATQSVYVGNATISLAQTFTYNLDGSPQDATELHDAGVPGAPATHTDYDALGRRIRVEHPDGSAETWIYDVSGRVAIQTTLGLQARVFTYDGAGRVVQVEDQAMITRNTYDAAGNLTQVSEARLPVGDAPDPGGKPGIVTITYDALNRQKTVADPRELVTDPIGLITQYSYNAVGQVTAVTRGPQAEVAAGGGHTVTASYYLLGQLRQVWEPVLGGSLQPRSGNPPAAGDVVYNEQTYQYDAAGRVTQLVDGNALTTGYTYDAAGRLIQVTDALNQVTEYEYDALGNRTKVWDALNPKGGSGSQATQFQYDELGRLLVTTDPTGQRTDVAYDASGNLVSRTEGRHVGTAVYQTTQYAYDAGHRVRQITYPNTTGKGPVTAVYAAYDGAGLRLFRRDDYGQAQYKYDVVGRPERVVSPQENTTYGYDGVGNLKSVTSSLGTTAYEYDAAHRMTKVTDPLGNVTQYAYDSYGHLNTLTLPDGFQRQMTYYSLPSGAKTDRLQSISTTRSTTTYWAGTYKYDYTGNVRSTDVNQAKTDLTPWTYALSADYDNLNRVTKWTDTSIESPAPQNLFYTYDAVGNRTAWGNLNSNPTQNYQTPTVPAATVDQNTSYDKASRMTSQNTTLPQDWKQLTTAGGQVLYEANGNLLQTEYTTPPGAGTYAYSLNAYNDASQLVSHKTAVDVGGSPAGWSNTEEYSYDGDGRRIDWKNTSCPAGGGSCTTQYKQYEYVGSTAVAERQQDGHVTVWYVLGAGGEPLYTLHWDTAAASLKPSIYAKDHLGSIRMVANSGGVENAYRYDAFVVPQVDQKTVANSIQGGGAPHDVPEMASGASTLFYPSLYNLRARLYDPLAGRFLTQDSYRGNP